MKRLDISFYKDVPGISTTEHAHWKRILPTILKIGVELEFNLKIERGDCPGYNLNCKCEHFEKCSPVPCVFKNKRGKCSLFIVGCSAKNPDCDGNCTGCGSAIFMPCSGDTCFNYIPMCIKCPNSTVRCDKCAEYKYARGNPDKVRRDLEEILEATNNFGKIGKYGVLQVVGDGSLVNKGLEIPTVGRRYDFDVFYEMLTKVMNEAYKAGGYLNERCSTHVHILAEYYTKLNNRGGEARHPDDDYMFDLSGLERPLPELILMNIAQIWRKFEPGIFWMSSGLHNAESLTRWGKFRCPITPVSPIKGMRSILDYVAGMTGNSKYGAINFRNCRFDGTRFHIEVRTMDGVKSPTYITAMIALFRAIVLRAVDMSVGGLIKLPKEETDKNIVYINRLVNGIDRPYGDDRVSYTTEVFRDTSFYIRNALDLIDFVLPALDLTREQIRVLRMIAEEPPAIHLINTKSKDPLNDNKLEEIYSKPLQQVEKPSNSLIDYINQAVRVNLVTDCSSVREWKQAVMETLNCSKEEFDEAFTWLVKMGLVKWDSKAKTVVCRR